MSAKNVLVICAQILLVKGIYAQIAGFPGATLTAEEFALAGNAYGAGFGPYGPGPINYGAGFVPAAGCGMNVAPTSGGGFAVTSTSPIAPTGITVVSENAIEGTLSIAGEMPFLGAVALEGALPTGGTGGINYGCGNGAIGMVSEGLAPPAPTYPTAYGPAGLAGIPYGPGCLGAGYGPRGF